MGALRLKRQVTNSRSAARTARTIRLPRTRQGLALKPQAVRNLSLATRPKVIPIETARAHRRKALTAPQQESMIVDSRLKARKLARSIMRRWHARIDIQELDSIVDLSLCESVRRFDPSRGVAFMTFLFYHLRGNLIRAVSAAVNINTVPFSETELARGFIDSEGGSGHSASAVEIAEALISEDVPGPDDILYQKELVEISQESCRKLDPLAQEVVARLYLKEEQLMDVAKSLGYSRCHISRVKKYALERLKTSLAHLEEGQQLISRYTRSLRRGRTLPKRRRFGPKGKAQPVVTSADSATALSLVA